MAPPSPPWADLQVDLLHEVFRWLACQVDRDRVPEVCGGWCAALPRHPPPKFLPPSLRDIPPPLPWLLLPSAGTASTRVSCVIDGHVLRHRISFAQGARFFGAYGGGWLFVALEQTHRHALVSLRTRHPELSIRALPDQLSLRDAPRLDNMAILAATLSAPPDDANCFGAAIATRWKLISGPRLVVFWRMGDAVAVDAGQFDRSQPALEVEDLVYRGGAFHCLTQGEHLRVYDPFLGEDGTIQLSADFVSWFQPREKEDGECVVARYILESRGRLLMVVRLGNPGHQLPTLDFKVYESVTVEQDGQVYYYWTQLETLGGRIIFVGRGCSTSYEADQYVQFGLEEGVCFLDDGGFYDDAMMFEGDNDRAYPCSDNGFWSEPPDALQRLYQTLSPSTSSSPIWLFH